MSLARPMHARSARRVALALMAAAITLLGCGKRRQAERPATPMLATVRLESLLREHPAYPQWERLSRSASPSAGRQAAAPAVASPGQKAEASPRPADSKGKMPSSARLRLPEGRRTVEDVADDARMLQEQHERFREGQVPPILEGPPAPARPPTAVARVPNGGQARQRELAAILRRETEAACRHIAALRGVTLRLPPDVPAEARDMTESFRGWLRDYWRESEMPGRGPQGATG